MFQIHSVAGRIAVGVVVGAVVGVLVNLTAPYFGFAPFGLFGLGTLILLVLMGLTIGLVGVFDRHPVFGFKMHWWIRGCVAGLLFSLMFVLLGYDSAQVILRSALVSWTGLTSPFWLLLDGMVVGLIVAFLETKIAGEGSHLPLT